MAVLHCQSPVVVPVSDRESAPPPAKKVRRKLEDDLDWLSGVREADMEDDIPASVVIDKELDRYFSESQTKEDPLQWWKDRESVFQHLSVLAKKYLGFPSSSVSSERVFSLARNISTKKDLSFTMRMWIS